jgi:hypothetical protein
MEPRSCVGGSVRRHLPHLLERAAVLKAALKRRHKLCDKLFIRCRSPELAHG